MMKKWIAGCLVGLLFVLAFTGCSEVDKNYGVSEPEKSEEKTAVEIPTIRSTDTVMPLYLDISLYDEENYASVYLGKKYQLKLSYGGTFFSVPTDYKTMTKNGWNLTEGGDYSAGSTLTAGKSADVTFVNPYGKQIIAQFYNGEKSSVKLEKCAIVKLIIKENSLNIADSVYDQFWINGVTNQSAITDVIEFLGAPTHFYTSDGKNYLLDYSLTKENRSGGIRVAINADDDTVTALEITNYK